MMKWIGTLAVAALLLVLGWLYATHPQYFGALPAVNNTIIRAPRTGDAKPIATPNAAPESVTATKPDAASGPVTVTKQDAPEPATAPVPAPVAADPPIDPSTWVTIEGTIYRKVKVVKAEADCVTILHAEGGARIPWDHLHSDVQKQYGYDPNVSKSAAAQRDAELAQSRAVMMEENKLVEARKQAALNGSASTTSTTTEVTSSTASTIPVATSATPTTYEERQKAAAIAEVKRRIAFYQEDLMKNQADAREQESLHHQTQYTSSTGATEYGYSSGAGGYRQAVEEDQKEIQKLQAALQSLTQPQTVTSSH